MSTPDPVSTSTPTPTAPTPTAPTLEAQVAALTAAVAGLTTRLNSMAKDSLGFGRRVSGIEGAVATLGSITYIGGPTDETSFRAWHKNVIASASSQD